MLYKEITEQIIASAIMVHKTLGNGFQEVIYQRALEIEMPFHNLNFIREKVLPIFYRNIEIGTRRVDFFVEEKIMVEIKALVKLEDVHLAQAMNYCEAYNIEIGLLINFGAKNIEFKRIHNNKLINAKIEKEKSISVKSLVLIFFLKIHTFISSFFFK